jgi:hypothetical protein
MRSKRGQHGSELLHADRLDLLADRVTVRAGVNDERARGLKVLAGGVKASFHTRRRPALDLDRPESVPARQFQHQIDLRAGRSAIEARRGPHRRGAEQVLDDKTFRPSATSCARVVLPTCRGPTMATAACRSRAWITVSRAWRWIILANQTRVVRFPRIIVIVRDLCVPFRLTSAGDPPHTPF